MSTRLLERLDGVREIGPGKWKAKCPAHEDKTPSLSIRELDDGTLLLHDFGGCHALDICRAVGIEFRDLFPAGRIRRIEPKEWPRLSASDALIALDHEASVVWFIAADVHQHREIDEPTWERLSKAVQRIGTARALCSPERLSA